MGSAADISERWCILRTTGPRTLLLAASLSSTGFAVWTPSHMISRRKGKARDRVDCAVPIIPTFVFARASAVSDLFAIAASPVSPHPAFSVFRHRDRIPLISDASLASLRQEEDRQRHKQLKATRREIDPGTRIRLTEGAFAGMTGIVERGNGKEAVVNFGAGFVVTIATYILTPEVVCKKDSRITGIAA